MKALIDSDVLRYEIGFAAEVGWRHTTGEASMPPWDYVEDVLKLRVNWIVQRTEADSHTLYLSSGRSFRDVVATTRPYKGHRVEKKPFHWKNISAYIKAGLLGDVVVAEGIEADDAIAMEHKDDNTIVCSRDKDFRQLSGWYYSWELANQPEVKDYLPWGEVGWVEHDKQKQKLTGRGDAFFCAQCLTGDVVDSIPGIPKVGPTKAILQLGHCQQQEEYWNSVVELYEDNVYLKEQATLLWLMRDEGKPWWLTELERERD